MRREIVIAVVAFLVGIGLTYICLQNGRYKLYHGIPFDTRIGEFKPIR